MLAKSTWLELNKFTETYFLIQVVYKPDYGS